MSGEERELRTGRCFNDMVVDKRVETEKGFLYCFKRAALRDWEREKERSSSLTDTSGRPKSASLPPSLSSLLDLAISAGDYLVISTVGGKLIHKPYLAGTLLTPHRRFWRCYRLYQGSHFNLCLRTNG